MAMDQVGVLLSNIFATGLGYYFSALHNVHLPPSPPPNLFVEYQPIEVPVSAALSVYWNCVTIVVAKIIRTADGECFG